MMPQSIAPVSDSTLSITYRFHFDDGEPREFTIELEKPGMHLRDETRRGPLPPWTLLTHHQCPGCPLDSATHPHCPAASAIVDVVETFKDVLSHEESLVEVVTPMRTYAARVKNTVAAGSLIGVYMAASGCPVLDKLRPMVLTHLPFASTEESIYRAISTYLMAQYFIARRGGVPDWTLENLGATYDEVNRVNQAFVKRLTSVVRQDAPLNAMVLLNCFATATRRTISQEKFEELEKLFTGHFTA